MKVMGVSVTFNFENFSQGYVTMKMIVDQVRLTLKVPWGCGMLRFSCSRTEGDRGQDDGGGVPGGVHHESQAGEHRGHCGSPEGGGRGGGVEGGHPEGANV